MHYSKNPKMFSFCYLHQLTLSVTTPYVTFCFMNESCLPDYYATTTDYLKSHPETDTLLFDQQCSLDQGKSSFIVTSSLINSNDNIPTQGPWATMSKRSLSNWSIYKSTLWKNIAPCNDDKELMQKVVGNIKSWHSLNKVLYTYVV